MYDSNNPDWLNSDCIFCKIIKRETPANILYEDDHILSFYTLSPRYTIHALIIPKIHIVNLKTISHPLDNQYFQYMYTKFNTIADILHLVDYRIIINSGPQARQTIFHLHAHITSGIMIQRG